MEKPTNYLVVRSIRYDSRMSSRRTYGDRCGIARALDLVGERWALLIVRELLLGPKRFTDLRAGLPLVSPDVLSQRLRELEQAGLVGRERLPPPAASRVYALTERGRELEPVLLALGRWGSRVPIADDEAAFGADSVVLALKTMFAPGAGGGISARYELRLGEDRFAVRIADGRFDVVRGTDGAAPDATLATDPLTLSALLWHGRSLAEAERQGAITIDGDRSAAKRFLKLFAAAPGR